MALYSRAADESVGYYETIAMDPSIADYTGWVFKLTLAAFVGDPNGITLNTIADAAAEGFRIVDGPGRLVSLRILAMSLQAYPDTTGQFVLFGNLLATPPGADRFHACDFQLTVQKGPTT